jgi:hypothetical protein
MPQTPEGATMKTARVFLAISAAALALCLAAGGAAAKPNSHAALDCSFCHFDTPRFGVDTAETVNFWRAEGDEPQLCERCHGPEANFHPLGVEPGPRHLGTRPPKNLPLGKSEAVRGQVVCVTCHFVHAANGDWALLRGFTGSSTPSLFPAWQDLCRECHGDGLEKRSPHAGDDRACAFCHATKPEPGQPTTITPQGNRLCEFCHGIKGEVHYAGVNPFTTPQRCTGCHDPHLGKDHPARLKAGYFDPIRDTVTINPHRRRTLCFACHADGKSGPLRAASAVALCQRCHDSGKIPGMSHPMTRVPAGYAIPPGWPLADAALTCLTCHFPGHVPGAVPGRAEEPGAAYLLRGGETGDRTAVCFKCHPKQQWEGRNPHRDAAQKKTGCTFCHAKQPVWGEDRANTVTFVADINIVCLACHDRGDHPAGIRHTVTLTAAMPAVPEALPLGAGRKITCATCHNPHLDPPVGHRLRGTKEPSAFCRRCHKY